MGWSRAGFPKKIVLYSFEGGGFSEVLTLALAFDKDLSFQMQL